jgi:hypothetical protein
LWLAIFVRIIISPEILYGFNLQTPVQNVVYKTPYSNVIVANTWYHLCLTIDGSYNAILYIDGVSSGTVVCESLINTNMIVLGTDMGSSFKGYLDEFIVYNRAITAEEVTTLYGLGNITDGRKLYYSLDSPFTNVYPPISANITGNISVVQSIINNLNSSFVFFLFNF